MKDIVWERGIGPPPDIDEMPELHEAWLLLNKMVRRHRAKIRPLTPEQAFALRELGLDRDAKPANVLKAFRQLAFAAHPDHGGSQEAFEELVGLRDDALQAVGGRR